MSMAPPFASLPLRRSDLVVRPLGDEGRYVVKNSRTGSYFQLGEQEHFLLMRLDGRQEASAICTSFEERFGEPLSEEEFEGFLALALERNLASNAEDALQNTESPSRCNVRSTPRQTSGPDVPAADLSRESLLYWRKNIIDPDRFFTRLEPKIRFFWTGGFLAVSTATIITAIFLLWTSPSESKHSFVRALKWETLAWAWLALFAVTILHESAHGLTCKHYGGEVHEIGFLLMYFMPCFYCNVSDAWLLRDRSKRLWVTFAGGYFELFLWSLAVFVWRLTVPASVVNYVAFVMLSVCGVRTLFNFNPLLKLDGYYLLSDWVEIPNLRQRAWRSLQSRLRWLLWGATRPSPEPRRGFLLSYGVVSWLFSLFFLTLMLWGFFKFLWASWGWLGLGAVALLAFVSVQGLFQGLFAGEFRKMITTRYRRTAVWVSLLGAAAGALTLIEIEDRAGAPFQTRPATRAELRAPVAGFIQFVSFDEGDRVSAGTLVARLDVPDLSSRTAQKRAEVREAQAKLRLLEVGPRPEEVAEQRCRVKRNMAWRDLAEKDLLRAQLALKEELSRLDNQIAQCGAEMEAARDSFERARRLRTNRATSDEEFQEAERRFRVANAQVGQAQSQKRHREALGTREAIAGLDAAAELARREKDLADGQAVLNLLEAGSRPEELEAQRALLARLHEEALYLEGLQSRVEVVCPVSGLVTTPRMKEKIGQYLHEGELIGQVEESATLEVEIAMAEEEVARVEPGQRVELKVRALPFQTFAAIVDRIAPRVASEKATAGALQVAPGETPGTVTVYCRLKGAGAALRPGMTGHARVYGSKRSIGAVMADRAVRYLRTEFWW